MGDDFGRYRRVGTVGLIHSLDSNKGSRYHTGVDGWAHYRYRAHTGYREMFWLSLCVRVDVVVCEPHLKQPG